MATDPNKSKFSPLMVHHDCQTLLGMSARDHSDQVSWDEEALNMCGTNPQVGDARLSTKKQSSLSAS